MKGSEGGRNPIRYLRAAGWAAALILLLYSARLVFLFPWTPSDLVRRDASEPADLIVVLEGEFKPRIRYAFSLVEQGYAEQIFTPGYDPKEDKEELIEQLLEGASSPVELHFGFGASSTYGEAVRTRAFAERHGIRTILLVTSNYHSFRSRWIFRKVLGNVKVLSATLSAEDNWFSPEQVEPGSFAFRLYRSEQLKFAAYYFAYGWRLYP